MVHSSSLHALSGGAVSGAGAKAAAPPALRGSHPYPHPAGLGEDWSREWQQEITAYIGPLELIHKHISSFYAMMERLHFVITVSVAVWTQVKAASKNTLFFCCIISQRFMYYWMYFNCGNTMIFFALLSVKVCYILFKIKLARLKGSVFFLSHSIWELSQAPHLQPWIKCALSGRVGLIPRHGLSLQLIWFCFSRKRSATGFSPVSAGSHHISKKRGVRTPPSQAAAEGLEHLIVTV